MKNDLKAALGTGAKPDITHVRTPMMNYIARASEYGNDKYERANYARPTQGGTKADFERFRGYLRSVVSHLAKTLDAMEYHQATDPQLENAEAMKSAALAPDTDVTPGAKVGASLLPHVAHAAAALNMAITQATSAGLLPEDPGQPWKVQTEEPKTGLDVRWAGEAIRFDFDGATYHLSASTHLGARFAVRVGTARFDYYLRKFQPGDGSYRVNVDAVSPELKDAVETAIRRAYSLRRQEACVMSTNIEHVRAEATKLLNARRVGEGVEFDFNGYLYRLDPVPNGGARVVTRKGYYYLSFFHDTGGFRRVTRPSPALGSAVASALAQVDVEGQ